MHWQYLFNPIIGGEALMKRAKFTKGLSISLDPHQFQKIKDITDQLDISIAEWLRTVVDDALIVRAKKSAPKGIRDQVSGG
jgi:hypothetical protein